MVFSIINLYLLLGRERKKNVFRPEEKRRGSMLKKEKGDHRKTNKTHANGAPLQGGGFVPTSQKNFSTGKNTKRLNENLKRRRHLGAGGKGKGFAPSSCECPDVWVTILQ